jgi:FecR protein
VSTISKSAATICVSVLFLIGNLPAQTYDEQGISVAPASNVRIVRLSQVKGAVQMDRNTGHGFEATLANLPIVEHSRLQTEMGVAEVEFEDNSTLRIGPGSMVEFTELDRLTDGGTVSSVRLVKGTAYVSLLKTKGNQFNLLFGEKRLPLPPASHIRLQVDGAKAALAVLDGTVRIDGSEGPADVSKKETVNFELQQKDKDPEIAKGFITEPLDAWDKTEASLHAQAGVNTAFGSPYSYGQGDMMYYGSFVNVGGCGSVWRPYFASAAWNPYDNGVWAWYPGAGYSWVSPYPWGWTAYHTGAWSYCSGVGWGWRSGGPWNGLNNMTGVVATGGGGVSNGGGGSNPHPLPPRPVRPPGTGAPTLMPVNQRPLVRSEVTQNSFVFRKDSAGLGVPRDGLGRLDKLSHSALDRGTATTPIYRSEPSSAPGNGRNMNGGVAVTSIHRGYAPAPEPQLPHEGQYNGGAASASSAARSGPQPGIQPSMGAPQPSSQQSAQMPQSSSQSGSTAGSAQGHVQLNSPR